MKKCPYCAEKVQRKAVYCKHCKSNLQEEINKQDKSKSLAKKKINLTPKKIGLIALVLFVLYLFGNSSLEEGKDKAKQDEFNNKTVELEINDKNNDKKDTLITGEEGIINNNEDPNNCEGKTALGVTKEDLDLLIDALVINDSEGMTDLVLQRKIFLVDNCKKIRKLDSGGFLGSVVKVRILNQDEGKIHNVGWMPYEYAIKQ